MKFRLVLEGKAGEEIPESSGLQFLTNNFALSRKDSHSTKFERRPQVLGKLSFREVSDSKLSDLRPFDNVIISLS